MLEYISGYSRRIDPVFTPCLLFCLFIGGLRPLILRNINQVYGQNTLNAPDLVWSRKLSRVGPGELFFKTEMISLSLCWAKWVNYPAIIRKQTPQTLSLIRHWALYFLLIGLLSVTVAYPSPDSIQSFLLSAVPPNHPCGFLSHDDFSWNCRPDAVLHAHVTCKLEKLDFGSDSVFPNVSHSGTLLERQSLWETLLQGMAHSTWTHSQLFKGKA